MDVGAHRRKMYGTEPSVENELWKRVFWCGGFSCANLSFDANLSSHIQGTSDL